MKINGNFASLVTCFYCTRYKNFCAMKCFKNSSNCYFSVTTVNVCEDSTLISAGFGDSTIKMWALSPNRLRSMKPLDDLNLIDKEAGRFQFKETVDLWSYINAQQ